MVFTARLLINDCWKAVRQREARYAAQARAKVREPFVLMQEWI